MKQASTTPLAMPPSQSISGRMATKRNTLLSHAPGTASNAKMFPHSQILSMDGKEITLGQCRSTLRWNMPLLYLWDRTSHTFLRTFSL